MGLTFNGKTLESITIGGKAVASLSINGDVVWPEQTQETFLTFIAKEAGSQIEWVSNDFVQIYYSQDKEHWTSLSGGDVLTASSVGDKFYFYGYNPMGENFVLEIYNTGDPAHFSTPTGSWDIAGKLTSLIDIDAPELESEWNCTFYGLFMSCDIVSAKNLILPNVLTYGWTEDWTLGCLQELFRSCAYLNEITTYYDTWDTSHTDSWVLGVAQTGNFYNLGGATIPRGSSGIPQGWTVQPTGPNYFYIQNETNGANTFSLHKYQNPETGTTIEYSFDKNNWVLCTYDSNNNCEITLNNQGDKVYFRSSDGFSERSSYTRNFVISLPVSVGGNMNTLLDYTDNNVSLYPVCFQGAFINCAVINATNLSLPSLTLANDCYRHMFKGCTSLQSVPVNLLPATTLAENCYREMFNECSSLTVAPNLPATTLAGSCYRELFYGCSSLTTAPNLPGINSTFQCYYSMFKGCTSLITPPQIAAVDMGFQSFYQMFYGCQSLEIGMDLKSISSVGYQSAREMYGNCYKLATVYAPNISSWDTNVFTGWMTNAGRDATGTKTFYAPSGLTIPTGDSSGIPAGWTRVNY